MLQHSPTSSLPHIIVGGTEELRLSALATAAELIGGAESGAKALLAEMGRAHVVADSEVPRNVVRMNSFVEFEIDGRDQRPVRLVFPAEADISRGKISILDTDRRGVDRTYAWSGYDGGSSRRKDAPS